MFNLGKLLCCESCSVHIYDIVLLYKTLSKRKQQNSNTGIKFSDTAGLNVQCRWTVYMDYPARAWGNPSHAPG